MTKSNLSFEERASLARNPLAKQLFHLMEAKQTNLAISADVTRASQLINIAETIGPEICVLKTHIDIVEDFTPALTHELKQIAIKHQFLIFEDRKFADIGNTVLAQYTQGIYHIADWADIINAHALPGPGLIKGLAHAGLKQDRGLLLIAQMSSQGNLIDEHYTQQSLTLAQQNQDFVIGFITQHAISNEPQWINFTPGIHLEQNDDALGQQYLLPETAILNYGTDVIIVGRGITRAADPLSTAQTYRRRGWESYIKRIKIA